MAAKVVAEQEEMQPLSEIMCNCELCYARLCVSVKENSLEDNDYSLEPPDNFHLPVNTKLHAAYASFPYPWRGWPVCGDGGMSKNFPFARVPYQVLTPETFLPVYPQCEWSCGSKLSPQMPCDGNFAGVTPMSPNPQLYLSKDSVLHLKLSAYVALERSRTAFRLINYRSNSALALSENGEYGYAYHYNCRGLINMHHEKLSITFDKDRQILLRTVKPSFVKKENEYYRLTSHHWTQCRPVSMDYFDRDKTTDILKKSASDKANDEAKVADLINNSLMHKDDSGLTREARIEMQLNGDVTLTWSQGERINALVVSPITGAMSMSTKNLSIIATPKSEIYISFADFFVHTGNHQMTVSSGAVVRRGNNSKSHPCLLKLVSSNPEGRLSDVRQFCPYMHNQGSHKGYQISTSGGPSGCIGSGMNSDQESHVPVATSEDNPLSSQNGSSGLLTAATSPVNKTSTSD